MRIKPAVLFGLLLVYIFFRGIGDHGLIDSVEGVNASVAAHMAGSGNYFVPKIGTALSSGSTMGSWWLSALGLKLFGWGEFAVRFFSALSGLIMVLASAKAARPYADDTPRKSWLAASICAGMTLSFIVSQLASPHSLYSCLMGLSMSGIVLSGKSKRNLVLAHISIALAFIAYGFEGLMLPMLAVLIYSIISEDWDLMRDFFTWPGGIIITLVISCAYFVALIAENPEIIHFMRCQNHEYTFGGTWGILILLFTGFLPFHGFIVRAVYEVFPREFPAKRSYELFMLVWALVFALSAVLSRDYLAMSACVPAVSALLGRKLDIWLTQRSFKSLRYAVMLNMIFAIPFLYLLMPFTVHNFPMIQNSMMSLIPWGIAQGVFIFASWYYTKTRQPEKFARNVLAAALICLMPLAGIFNLTADLYSLRNPGMRLRDIIKGNDIIIQYGVNHPSMYFYTLRNSRIIDADFTPGVAERKFESKASDINKLWGGKNRVFLLMPSNFQSEEHLPQNIFHISEGEGLLLLSNQ